MTSLKQQDGSFEAIRQHLLRNSHLFAQRASEARNGVAEAGWRLVEENGTIITHGASRCVLGLLERAVKARVHNFNVIYIRDETRVEESDRVVRELRAHGIAVAEIDPSSLAHAMEFRRNRAKVMVGAEVVMQSGGIISRMGTYQIAQLARACNIPFYVCAETHKFSRIHCDGQDRLGFQQQVLDFSTDEASKRPKEPVDFTPHRLVTELITENGVKLTTYVFEQVLDIYGTLRRS
jgi:translation initiation factor eIF-2B subunit alpha